MTFGLQIKEGEVCRYEQPSFFATKNRHIKYPRIVIEVTSLITPDHPAVAIGRLDQVDWF